MQTSPASSSIAMADDGATAGYFARRPALRTALVVALLSATIAYLVWRTAIKPEHEIDFRYYWSAGRAWAAGLDPYAPGFAGFAAGIVPPGNVVSLWAYPPHWWPISRFLSLFDITAAVLIWRLMGSAAMLVGTAMVVTARQARDADLSLLSIAVAIALTLVEPTAQAIAYGQSSLVVYTGVCLVAAGCLRASLPLMAVGLAVAALKPQVGVLLFCFLAPNWRNWPAIIAAGAIALAAALPQFVQHGFVQTLQEMRGNLPQTNAGAFTMAALTGPVQLLARAGMEVPALVEYASAAVVCVVAGAANIGRNGEASRLPLGVALAAIGALAPLHTYDLTILILPIIIAWRSDIADAGRIAMFVAVALLIRPSKLEALLGFQIYGNGVSIGAFFATVAALIVLAVTVAALVRERAGGQRAAAPPQPA